MSDLDNAKTEVESILIKYNMSLIYTDSAGFHLVENVANDGGVFPVSPMIKMPDIPDE